LGNYRSDLFGSDWFNTFTERGVMSDTTTTSSGGIGFVGLLTIVFIVLKLVGTITWSWWWVLSPIWISFAFSLSILLLIGIGILIYVIFFKK